MFDIVGFVRIKHDAQNVVSVSPISDFQGKPCRVIEFAQDGSALIISPKGDALAMVEKDDIGASFMCGYMNGVVLPPNLDFYEKMEYLSKVSARKGGYNFFLCGMVITMSLIKGEFSDYFLWSKQ